MVRIAICLTLATLVCGFCRSAAIAQPRSLETITLIVIDPGHGGEDLGAVGVMDVPEKKLTLAMARWMRDGLRAAYPDLRVELTRDADAYPTLDERTRFANELNADVFVSVHFNAALNPEANGVETFYIAHEGTVPGDIVPGREDDGPSVVATEVGVVGDVTRCVVDDLRGYGATEASAQLAEILQAQLVARLGSYDRNVRQGRFRVLRGARMPAVVVELGFLTHRREAARVIEPVFFERTVEALVEAIGELDARRAQESASADVAR